MFHYRGNAKFRKFLSCRAQILRKQLFSREKNLRKQIFLQKLMSSHIFYKNIRFVPYAVLRLCLVNFRKKEDKKRLSLLQHLEAIFSELN